MLAKAQPELIISTQHGGEALHHFGVQYIHFGASRKNFLLVVLDCRLLFLLPALALIEFFIDVDQLIFQRRAARPETRAMGLRDRPRAAPLLYSKPWKTLEKPDANSPG